VDLSKFCPLAADGGIAREVMGIEGFSGHRVGREISGASACGRAEVAERERKGAKKTGSFTRRNGEKREKEKGYFAGMTPFFLFAI